MDGHSAEVVDQRGRADRRHISGSIPHASAAAPASLATPTEWPERYGETRSAKLPIAASARCRRLLQDELWRRLGGEDLRPRRGALVERKDLLGVLHQTGRDVGVERVAATLAHNASGVHPAAE